jgi:hypothetical protein
MKIHPRHYHRRLGGKNIRHPSSFEKELGFCWCPILLAILLVSTCSAQDTDGTGGSAAEDGTANNPYSSGCLYASQVPGWESKWRVCNSQDPVELRGVICAEPEFDYMEIRVVDGDWPSIQAMSWIAQIMLSELVGVPTSIETGNFDYVRNFYNVEGRNDYGWSENSMPVVDASNGTIFDKYRGDCRAVTQSADNYEYCGHFLPEYWWATNTWVQDAVSNGLLEPTQGVGLLGNEGWFVTKFTTDIDPSVIGYFGLRGEDSRRKLAELFLYPTTWKEYCDEVSANNCTRPDDVAKRYPDASQEEEDKYFAEELFTGHFRATEASDCDTFPQNCTGHAANYPCDWFSMMLSHIYHLDIPLNAVHYQISQLQEL